MATVILLPLTGSTAHFENAGATFSSIGGSASGCVQVENDGEFNRWDAALGGQAQSFSTQFNKLNIPVGATITDIVWTIVHRTSDTAGGNFDGASPTVLYYGNQSANFNVDGLGAIGTSFDAPHASGLGLGATFETWFQTFPPDNPMTGLPWVRDDFDSIWFGTLFSTVNIPSTYDIDYLALTVTYTDSTPQACYYNPLINKWVRASVSPGLNWFKRDCPAPDAVEFTITPTFGSINGGD